MDSYIFSLAKELAKRSVDIYNANMKVSTFVADNVNRKVYDELLIGVRNKSTTYKLAQNIVLTAMLAHYSFDKVELSRQNSIRATKEVHSLLLRLINDTNQLQMVQYGY